MRICTCTQYANHANFHTHVKGCPRRRYIAAYRSPQGRDQRPMLNVRVGEWLHYTPFNLRPRIIIKLWGRKFVWALADCVRGRVAVSRLGTGIAVRAGRLGNFSTLADR